LVLITLSPIILLWWIFCVLAVLYKSDGVAPTLIDFMHARSLLITMQNWNVFQSS